ncbi:MAG: aryl-sulfate sulfotransferase [Reichenbachiella sp.]|uniref:aryl-sulfate sulfotransferase n=1 Tax=Reichenbachiella sp. TaxID=2184521 RepID=UPI003266164C
MNIFKHTPLTALIFIWVALSNCATENLNFIGEIVATSDSSNELRMHIDFEIDQKSSAYVSYWTETNPDKIFHSQLSQSDRSHHLTLVGLKGGTTYQYQVSVSNVNTSIQSEVEKFTTSKFPINVLHLRWEPEERTGLSGYILSQRRLVNGVIFMIDDDGDVVWYQQIPKQPKLSHWTARHTILVLYGAATHRNSSGDHIVEYDLYGNERFHLNLSELDIPLEAHHEVRFDENDNLLTLVYQHKTFDLSSIGGKQDQSVMGDKIVRMDTAGNVLWEWSVFDYTNPLKDSTILRTAEDWSHSNSLSIDSDGNYLVSFRNFNQVWKVDSKSGKVLWKLGKGGDIEMEPSAQFSGQHAFHVNPEGDYMVFDNGRQNRQTRILTYQIDEANKKATVGLKLQLPENLYSDRMGNAYLMDNDNMLVCAPRTNSLVIMNQKGEILGKAHVGIPDPYRAEFVRSLYPLDHVRD